MERCHSDSAAGAVVFAAPPTGEGDGYSGGSGGAESLHAVPLRVRYGPHHYTDAVEWDVAGSRISPYRNVPLWADTVSDTETLTISYPNRDDTLTQFYILP